MWLHDIDRRQTVKLTTDPSADRFPIFSPDGLRLVFASNRENPEMSGLYDMPSNGAEPEQRLLPPRPGTVMLPRDWAAGGTQLVYESGAGFGQQRDILILPLSPGQDPIPFAATTADERHPALSPDGQWIAYASNESGGHRVFVRSFPGSSAKVVVGAGRFPRWSGDGRELFYIDPDGMMIAASVGRTPTVAIAKTTPLFKVPFVPPVTDLDVPYDVTTDGQRFLMSAPVGGAVAPAPTSITVILGWMSLLENRARPLPHPVSGAI